MDIKINQICAYKHMTRRELSNKSGVPYRTISNWANGISRPNDMTQLKSVADALGLPSVDHLYLYPDEIKLDEAIRQSNVHKGVTTTSAILGYIPASIANKLNSDEYALLMDCINRAYHDGKSSTGAEMIDKNSVWVTALNRVVEWDNDGKIL